MTYSLGLDFVKPGKAGLPHPPISRIYIKTHSENERGTMFITPDCLTLVELEWQIERLQNELEEIRRLARKKFSLT